MVTTPTVTPAAHGVKQPRVPREQQLALRALGTAIAAAHAAGLEFRAVVHDLLSLKLTTARLVDALREARA
jgi:hypothetical protein